MSDTSELLVGVLTARTFHMSDNRLHPITNRTYSTKLKVRQLAEQQNRSWHQANAVAMCNSNHPVPDLNCQCGIYSFNSVQEVASQYSHVGAHRVLGVVAPAGVAFKGSRGIRSQSAEIIALWVDQERGLNYNPGLPDNYPTVDFYTSLPKMLERYPAVDNGGYAKYLEHIPHWIFSNFENLQQTYIFT